MRILLDTNIVIAHFRDDREIVPLFDAAKLGKVDLVISVITEFELLRYPQITAEQEADIAEILRHFSAFPVDRAVAQTASIFYRRRPRQTNDLLIAATAVQHDIPLLTRNTSDYRGIPELNLLTKPPQL